MIFVDASEGLSGDMLLAGMLALLDTDTLEATRGLMSDAADAQGVEFRLNTIDDEDDKGLGISYLRPEPAHYGASYEECFSRLASIEADLKSSSPIGRVVLEHIFGAEAEAHGVPAREVHLHEIARPQAMLNIAGIGKVSSVLLDNGAEGFTCSTIVTGSGLVVVSHGAIRVPAPASRILLRGLRHEPGTSPGERATPTGIAAVKALVRSQTDELPRGFSKKGIGFGTKRFAGRLGRTSLYWA